MTEIATIELDVLAKANLSLIQNKIPVVRDIKLTNNTSSDMTDLTLVISSNPVDAINGISKISLLRSGERLELENPSVNYSWDFFQKCTEKVSGSLFVKVLQDNNVIAETSQSIEFTSGNTWLGQATPIELLCSYITPNSDGIQKIIRSAATILEEKTGSSSLDGYQSQSKERVYDITQSIYLAIRKLNIVYAEPPASFEKYGQKIRMVQDIISHQLATCLDTSLLFAACLEQCGLNSLVFILRGHAFTGVWLEEKNLPRAFDDDPQFFRKRIQLQEICVFETTFSTNSTFVPFREVEKKAELHFEEDHDFQYGIDVKYCRSSAMIYPINEMKIVSSADATEESSRAENQYLNKREFKEIVVPTGSSSRKSELEMWKDKLLDLTFRNRLLNFKSSLSTVKIECNNPDEIEDLLADGSTFELLPKPESKTDTVRVDGAEILKQKIAEGFKSKKLITNLAEQPFQNVLKKLFREIREVLEETGANTLYLTLGVLEWLDKEKGQIRHSPLILLPVELNKKAIGLRYSIKMRDDETFLNQTLLQKLERDFGLKFPTLDPIPTDDSGVDVSLIFDTIRSVIKDSRGWELKEEVWLSDFTFQKYLMWKELSDQFEELKQSPVVSRIMGEVQTVEENPFVSESQIDTFPLVDTFCPLSADSSQLAAIFSANAGKSFVLQGPPGSGKSQTITNMISHCLAHGKTVLFVSEKRVALDVVYKRLKSVGLGNSCLELHSKKSEKRSVIQSFYDALEAKSIHNGSEWESIAQNLEQIRDGLNLYFKELHDTSNGGISAYSAFSKAMRSHNFTTVNFDKHIVFSLGQTRLKELTLQIERWKQYAKSFSSEEYHSWKYYKVDRWSANMEDRLNVLFEGILQNIETRNSLLNNNSILLPFSNGWNEIKWRQFRSLLELLLKPLTISFNFLDSQNWDSDFAMVKACIQRKSEYDSQVSALAQVCDLKILQEDWTALNLLVDQSEKGFIVTRWIASFKLNGILKKYQKIKQSPRELVSKLEFIHDNQEQNRTDDVLWRQWFSAEFKLENTPDYLSNLERVYSFYWQFSALYGDDLQLLIDAKTKCKSLYENRSMLLAESGENYKKIKGIYSILTDQTEKIEELISSYQIDSCLFEKEPDELNSIVDRSNRSRSKLRDLCAMNAIRNEVTGSGFGALFDAIDRGSIAIDQIVSSFEFNFYTHWLSQRLESTEILGQLSGQQLTLKDTEFRDVSERYQQEVKNAVYAKVTQNKPHISYDILPSSPLGTIVKEHKKSRKHLPIRQFLSSIKPVIKDLKPCFLMSPLSVSQYLDVATDFDIVIFDEASQIQPWDAIGSMARGKQAIVVGDSKQLPPTGFFSANGEESDDEKIDCESLLEMFATLYPELLLKWHYRSRSESLISFSNFHIYNNRLHTFPSVNTNDQAVTLEVVSGTDAFYDRGKTKTNRREAITVVSELFRRLAKTDSTKSIGIVTFSTPQATLIEDLIDEEVRKQPEFAQYFESSDDEYVFVKNLESVQGDERDVIFFSIGYGKDVNGVINRNFGPLNNSGGERRLNVAVTRAREEVKIFSNFHASEFDTGSSKSEGLTLLKEYLSFAENGHSALFKRNTANEVSVNNAFEELLAQSLVNRGWKVHTKIGVGGYRIDLGVVHPENDAIFLAGIECDGARYTSAASARDRDILRKSILEGLGWTVIRVWSTDWWYDHNSVIENLHTQLLSLLNVEPKVSESNEEIAPQSSVVDAPYEDIKSVQVLETAPECNDSVVSAEGWYDPTTISITPRGEFFDSKAVVTHQINEIVSELAPISKDECYSLIRKGWGFARAGNQIRQFLDECSSHIMRTTEISNDYFWSSPEQLAELQTLRFPPANEKRHPNTISPQELGQGILAVLQLNKEVESLELYRMILGKLGYASMSKDVQDIFDNAVDYLQKQGKVFVSGSVVSLGGIGE